MKQNDIAKIARDEVILKKLEAFSNVQTVILENAGKTNNFASLSADLPEKLVGVPNLESGFALLNDPIITVFGISLIFFVIIAVDARRAGIERSNARDRLNLERRSLHDEREQLHLQREELIAAKSRYDAQVNTFIDVSRRVESDALSQVDLNTSINNINDNLQLITSSLNKIETKEVSTQVDMAFSDFFG